MCECVILIKIIVILIAEKAIAIATAIEFCVVCKWIAVCLCVGLVWWVGRLAAQSLCVRVCNDCVVHTHTHKV